MKNNLLFIHGGGPTAVLNCSLWGALDEAKKHSGTGCLYAALGGTGGFLKERLFDLRELPPDELELLKTTPGSFIGTSRDRLSEDDYRKMAGLAGRYGIKYILVNGGNGTMDACGRLAEACSGMDVRVIGIPKTMDNDIAVTDHCPGYGSAARYIAGSIAEVAADVAGMPIHVVIIETSGRNAGWLAASAALAGPDAADLIYVPERLFSEDEFLEDVTSLIERKRSGIVVASEGLRGEDGELLVRPLRVVGRSVSYGSVAGHLRELIANRLGYKARGEKPGILGRASVTWQSVTDREEAIVVGREAVRAALAGESGKMVGFERISDNPYKIKTKLIDIKEVMLSERKLPEHFINSRGNYVTEEFIDYCTPLIGGQLPRFAKLKIKKTTVV
ncbi:MAG TPA: diphosphate--fructose-6-phosphate 1-phosphotransferase [Clostridiales bacterium]|nr:diphosphate--fructose-6-phosphate 1-phosphotransferase [Clostridiales bacterium]